MRVRATSRNIAFDICYEWSKTLENDHIDEDSEEIEHQNRGGITSRAITVRGQKEGVPVVVHYNDWYNTAHFTSRVQRYLPNVLEFFITNNSIGFSGEIRKRNCLEKIFGGGLKPSNHPLFRDYKLILEESGTNTGNLGDTGFCDGLLTIMQLKNVWKIEFQESTGLSVFCRIAGNSLTTGFLDNMFNMLFNLKI